jgi:outer membrane protein OmpA-like peptidoglycan-associated protein
MTSLAVIFILLFLGEVTKLKAKEREEKQKEAHAAETVNLFRTEIQKLLDEMAKFNDQRLRITQDPDDPLVLFIRLDNDTIQFDHNKATLLPQSKLKVRDLFSRVGPKICDPRFRQYLHSVIVEGHADRSGEQVDGGLLDNFLLSSHRAHNVLTLVYENQIDAQTTECFRTLVASIGRGSGREIAKPSRPFDKVPENRRVEIKIRFKSESFLSSEQLAQLKRLALDAK